MALGLVATTGRADDVPGIGDWPHYHFSLDETPVTVVLVHDSGKRDFPVLTVPRSYIYFAHRAPPSTEGPLPDRIETDQLGLAFTDPDGEAWSAAIQDHMAATGQSANAAGKSLRPFQYKVTLSPNTNAVYAETVRQNTRRNHLLIGEPFPGIQEHSRTGTSSSFFVTSGDHEFLQASCYNPLNEVYFCEYRIMITKDIVATIDFLDFRVHGGPDYANWRVRFAREVVCRFLDEC
jgi:hypothetical protein